MMTREEFSNTGFQCTYTEWAACYCVDCDRRGSCQHDCAYRRFPVVDGGLALCPRLKELYADVAKENFRLQR